MKPILYALIAGRQGAALISTCHLWAFDSGKEWALSAVERCLLHLVDRIMVVSDQILPPLRRFGLKADVIYNGIELAPLADTDTTFRQKMGWTGRPVIGAIARLARQKGLQHLLRAAPELLRSHPDALFVFAGDGPDRESLETEANRFGIQNSVSFLGVRRDTSDILASIDDLAMPSISESLPMALLEAMAAAKPVVATDVGAIPRVIKNRVNGILLSPGETGALATALQELLNSRELRSNLGRNARNTVETNCSAGSMASQYAEVCLELSFNKCRAVTAS
jgi:glycosyltransferase involved in cell wall biosynthesis